MIKDLILTNIGSLPQELYKDDAIESAIHQAVNIQRQAKQDYLTDGQFRDNIADVFRREQGLIGDHLPYRIVGPIGTPQNCTILDDLILVSQISNNAPIIASITGPIVIADGCELDQAVSSIYPNNSIGFSKLAIDIAKAQGQQARLIGDKAEEINVKALKIDEPTFAYGTDLQVEKDALQIIVDEWRKTKGKDKPVILHVCGDYSTVWNELIEMPVDILNIESFYIDALSIEQRQQFQKSGKKIALGCVAVNSYNIHPATKVVQDVIMAIERLGENNIWGLTPICGLRESSIELAQAQLETIHDAKKLLEKIWQDDGRAL